MQPDSLRARDVPDNWAALPVPEPRQGQEEDSHCLLFFKDFCSDIPVQTSS